MEFSFNEGEASAGGVGVPPEVRLRSAVWCLGPGRPRLPGGADSDEPCPYKGLGLGRRCRGDPPEVRLRRKPETASPPLVEGGP